MRQANGMVANRRNGAEGDCQRKREDDQVLQSCAAADAARDMSPDGQDHRAKNVPGTHK